ncbi:MAG: hypothetical protein IJW25_02395 [Clostridia bacterium]|nr:hypothetical protein [Clostridia bacterium]
MDIVGIANMLSKIATVKNVDKNVYEIITGAKINSKNPVKIYLVEENGTIKLTDKKFTLKYMNQIYELKSLDVKNCISAVVKIYGFTIVSGELISVIRSEESLKEVFYNFIICVGQLANMYAFFDKP